MMAKRERQCWCDNSHLSAFSSDYAVCQHCGTLVSQVGLSIEQLTVRDDSQDFYGREYWFTHQEQDLGYKNITLRARLDLPERCLHWLRTILKYKAPTGKVLELGSAHGGFVALLRQAGFDATGLELSAWIVDFARKTFDVPMLLGPVEDQHIEPGTLDVIALMDVLEHLPDPVGTMSRCLELLKPDGIMVIQTPCYSGNKTYQAMLATTNPFLEQLKSNEHLYLFSQPAIRKLFHGLKAEHLAFEPPMFSHYDMFVVVSCVPLTVNSAETIEQSLSQTGRGRLVQALLDKAREVDQLHAQADQLHTQLAASEADRAARLDVINQLAEQLEASEADRAARLDVIQRLDQQLQASEADRAARLDVIQRLKAQLDSINGAAGTYTAPVFKDGGD